MVTAAIPSLQHSVRAVLDSCLRAFERDEVEDGMSALVGSLHRLRAELEPAEWRKVCEQCRQHPICAYVHQDPLIARAYAKPRGYPGDAITLDYHYREWDGLLDGVSDLGKRLLEWSTQHPVSCAVRERCLRVAEAIDATAERVASPRILSVAAGHVREGKLSTALNAGRVGELIALDQDAQSLARLPETCAGLAVTPLHAKINDVVRNRVSIGGFDLIYSIGMYDYLDLPTAQLVTQALFERLNPGGRVLIGNFLTDMLAEAYGESFGDWWLILRSPEDLREVAATVPADRVAAATVVCDDWDTIGYLELVRV